MIESWWIVDGLYFILILQNPFLEDLWGIDWIITFFDLIRSFKSPFILNCEGVPFALYCLLKFKGDYSILFDLTILQPSNISNGLPLCFWVTILSFGISPANLFVNSHTYWFVKDSSSIFQSSHSHIFGFAQDSSSIFQSSHLLFV